MDYKLLNLISVCLITKVWSKILNFWAMIPSFQQMIFIKFTDLCNHHHKCPLPPKTSHDPLQSIPIIIPSPRSPILYYPILSLCFLWIFHISKIIHYVVFSTCLLLFSILFYLAFLFLSIPQKKEFVSFYCSIIFYYSSCFVYIISVDEHLNYFHFGLL